MSKSGRESHPATLHIAQLYRTDTVGGQTLGKFSTAETSPAVTEHVGSCRKPNRRLLLIVGVAANTDGVYVHLVHKAFAHDVRKRVHVAAVYVPYFWAKKGSQAPQSMREVQGHQLEALMS